MLNKILHGFWIAMLACLCHSAAAAAEPAPAENVRHYGAIDLGSKGVKAFLYSFVHEGEGIDAKAVYKNDINTKLVSAAQGDRFTPDGITEATQAVSTLLKQLKTAASDNHLTNVEYYIIGSSGVAKFANRDELKTSVDKETGLAMSFVDATQEGYYGLLSAVPELRRGQGVLVDIGSGNTKIACLVGESAQGSEIPYGSVTLRKAAVAQAKSDKEYRATVDRILSVEVKPTLQGCGSERRRIYWIGGAAWATATYTHPERATWGYVPITRADLESFLTRLDRGTWNQGEPKFQFAADVPPARRAAITKAALADWKSVQNAFSREDLIAGVSLMKTLLDGHKQAPLQFLVRNGNYLFGYALDRYREDSGDGATATTALPKPPSYFAGIDLGSKGVKAFIYSFVQEGEGVDARVVFNENISTKLVSGAKDKKFTADGIEEATSATRKLIDKMHTVAAEKNIETRFYIVGSSGVAAFENKADLKASVDKATGLSMEFVDAKTEGLYALYSAVPATRRQEGFVVDIGSGNTKLACMTADISNTAEIPFGTVTARTAVPSGADYEAGLKGVMERITASYRVERMNTPCLGNRSRIYFVGGTPWATATFTRPETALWGYVPLRRPDIDAFYAKLLDGSWNQGEPRFDFDAGVSPARREATRKAHVADRKNVQDVFSREDLLAGVSLLRTILDNGNGSARVFFVRNGNYLFGYALEKFKDISIASDGDEVAKK